MKKLRCHPSWLKHFFSEVIFGIVSNEFEKFRMSSALRIDYSYVNSLSGVRAPRLCG
jgi:hypothetical protein